MAGSKCQAEPQRTGPKRTAAPCRPSVGPHGSVVSAEIWSANLAIKAKFDAASWLERARSAAVDALAANGWSGGGSEAELVRYFVPLNEEVALVVSYARRKGIDVYFSVDRQAATAWIQAR